MPETPNDPIEVWFQLHDKMIRNYAVDGVNLRPPSLRDACYAYVLSIRSTAGTSPETIEAFVNGLELGAMAALRKAWEKHNG